MKPPPELRPFPVATMGLALTLGTFLASGVLRIVHGHPVLVGVVAAMAYAVNAYFAWRLPRTGRAVGRDRVWIWKVGLLMTPAALLTGLTLLWAEGLEIRAPQVVALAVGGWIVGANAGWVGSLMRRVEIDGNLDTVDQRHRLLFVLLAFVSAVWALKFGVRKDVPTLVSVFAITLGFVGALVLTLRLRRREKWLAAVREAHGEYRLVPRTKGTADELPIMGTGEPTAVLVRVVAGETYREGYAVEEIALVAGDAGTSSEAS